MDWIEWGKFALICLSFIVGTAIPFMIAVSKAVRKRKHATTDAEKAQADAELMLLAKTLIVTVEKEYADYNKYLKEHGHSAGSSKKNAVLTDLRAYALEKGYSFDTGEWNKTIDSLVEFTKNVNVK